MNMNLGPQLKFRVSEYPNAPRAKPIFSLLCTVLATGIDMHPRSKAIRKIESGGNEIDQSMGFENMNPTLMILIKLVSRPPPEG